ncbi:MAG: PIN domain-containing protein [Methylobacter sp.]|nr:PIN domain-containing protein [Methylobacter sp.]
MPGEFIDTNIVIYSLSQNDPKQDKTLALLTSKPVISVQVLSETANIVRRKLGFDSAAIRAVINRISQECLSLQPLTVTTLNGALDIADRYGFAHYDSLIIASALQAGCATLYSEDMQHGQTIDSRMTIINPFM